MLLLSTPSPARISETSKGTSFDSSSVLATWPLKATFGFVFRGAHCAVPCCLESDACLAGCVPVVQSAVHVAGRGVDDVLWPHAGLGASGSQLQSALLYFLELWRHTVKETWPPTYVEMPPVLHLIQEDLYQYQKIGGPCPPPG